jgi:hypothetical protein
MAWDLMTGSAASVMRSRRACHWHMPAPTVLLECYFAAASWPRATPPEFIELWTLK